MISYSTLLDRVGQNNVDQLDHRRLFGGRLERSDVELLLLVEDLEGLGLRRGHLVHDLF
jgi:hypothetical protein